ncbi:MAG: universal stress protein [Chloroflexota bacterium]
MYQKILVPLDGSELAECALEHLRTIVKGCHVPEVVLLNVASAGIYIGGDADIGFFPDAGMMNRLKENYHAWANSYLNKITQELQQDGITAKGVLLEGYVADQIMDYAQKNGVDLIIMSTHGRSGPARWAMGSVADRVMRHSTVPVLVVSPHG